jgi:hypothetical protein
MPLEPQHKKIILEALVGFDQNIKILVHGIGRYNQMHKLESFDSIEHISILDALDVAARLEELSALKDGWLDGKGKALDNIGLAWLTSSFDFLYDNRLPLPHLYPTAEGGIQAEWSFNSWEISLEIDLINKTGEYQELNVATNKSDETKLNLAENEGWTDLNSRLSVFAKDNA